MMRAKRQRRSFGRMAAAWLILGGIVAASGQTPSADPAQVSSGQRPVVLDSVIAVINGDVLLRSDLQAEMNMSALQPLSLPPGSNFERRAARRLINRTLILQQMQNQGMARDVSDEEVQKDLQALRGQLPACSKIDCNSEAGWDSFLAEHNLTPSEVTKRWRQRMQILSFIDTRFRAGVRIALPDIKEYYNKTFVPQFTKENVSAPSLASVSDRIEEILLQKHVNSLLQDWLNSLRDQGSVIILDPALGESNPNPDDEEGEGA